MKEPAAKVDVIRSKIPRQEQPDSVSNIELRQLNNDGAVIFSFFSLSDANAEFYLIDIFCSSPNDAQRLQAY